MPRPGLLDVIACAWDLDRDVSSWLADLSDCSARVLPGVEGAVCWLSRVGEEGPQLVAAEGQGDLLAWMMRDHEGGLEEGALDAAYASAPMVASMRSIFDETWSSLPNAMAREFSARDLHDVVTVAPKAGNDVVTLALPIPRRHGVARDARLGELMGRWQGVGHQLRQALVARRALGGTAADASLHVPDVIADFDARGRGDFRFPHLRPALVEQSRRVSSAEGGAMAHLGVWEDLIAGRYSIIAHREHTGRRRFLAIQNAAEQATLRALSRAERMVVERLGRGDAHKAIAADLGVRTSSVANVAARALQKLGVADVAQLAMLHAGLARPT
ncbi:MAG: hypothetical protein IPG81_24415 [Sandaracinaceae bacterium]|nr:hypothetical protein [Sandaracinaceae bacterium]